MRFKLLMLLAVAMVPSPCFSNFERIDRSLNQMQPWIDPGPKDIPITGVFLIRVVEPWELPNHCPGSLTKIDVGCIDPISLIITIPNPDKSKLNAVRQLDTLRHEFRHANELHKNYGRPFHQ